MSGDSLIFTPKPAKKNKRLCLVYILIALLFGMYKTFV